MRRGSELRRTPLKRKSYLRRVSAKALANQAQWQQTRRKVLLRDGYRCVACGRPVTAASAEVDHIARRGLGGGKRDDSLENLRTMCRPCHHARHEAERHPRWTGMNAD